MSKDLKLGVYALCVAIFEANQQPHSSGVETSVHYDRFKQMLRSKTATSQILINYIGEKEAVEMLSNPAVLSRKLSEESLVAFNEENNNLSLTEKGLELAKEFETAYLKAEERLDSESKQQVLALLHGCGIKTMDVAKTTQLSKGEFSPTFYHPQFTLVASLKGERIAFVHGIGVYKLDNIQDAYYPTIKALQNQTLD